MALAGSKNLVEIEGYKELSTTIRKLKDKGLRQELVATNKAAAMLVAREGGNTVPVQSGRLFKSIRALGSVKGAQVRAGTKVAVPYAGPIHFGWYQHSIEPQPFLYTARDRRHSEVKAMYAKDVPRLMQAAIDKVQPPHK